MAEKLVYRGKSKDVYEIEEGHYRGKYRFVFTDRATGYIENGSVIFDPGYDNVVGDIPGKGAIACRFATHFFRLLKEKGIPSHYIETISENEMIVEPAIPISMPAESPEILGSAPLANLEFTWRNNATGSFWRRYPFVRPCKNLFKVVEAWTKGKTDILITMEALEAAGALTKDEIAHSVNLVKQIAEIVSNEFTTRNLHVVDGKFELGRLKFGDGKIVLIDEISPDVLRVCRGFAPDMKGNCTVYMQCTQTTFINDIRTIKNKNQVSASEFVNVFL